MKKIAVVGAGTMGNGIAHTFAQNCFSVALIDQSSDALEKALQVIQKNLDRQLKKGKIDEQIKSNTLANIRTFTELERGVNQAALVIEAVYEKFEIKKSIFEALDRCTPSNVLFASNTSSISITKLAAVTQRPDRVIGMHFMNPVPVMKLVEIINGYATSKETTQTIIDLTKEVGKIPFESRDYPGFIANRILMPMINEAIITLNEGVAGVEEIDMVMKLGMAHPMGPLQLADFIGLDVCLSILEVLYQGLNQPKYAPSPLLVNMVLANRLGVKTKEGFYDYLGDSPKVSCQFLK